MKLDNVQIGTLLVILAVAIGIAPTYIRMYMKCSRWKALKMLRENGALKFMADVCNAGHIIESSRCMQEEEDGDSIFTEPRCAIRATVCDERIIGHLKDGKIRLRVTRAETRLAIERAWHLMSDPKDTAHFSRMPPELWFYH